MWPFRELHFNGVARTYLAARQDNSHDTGLADELSLSIVVQHGCLQTRFESIDLDARIAKPGDLDDGVAAHSKAGPSRETKNVETTSGHVLTHLTRIDFEPSIAELVVKLGMDQVHLTQVWLIGVVASDV